MILLVTDIENIRQRLQKEIPLINDEFEFIDIYEFRKSILESVILVKHKVCNREIPIIFHNFKTRKQCKYCNGKSFDHQAFIEKFNKRDDSHEYEFITEFLKMNEKIKVRHKKCGNIYDVKPVELLYDGQSKCVCNYGRYYYRHTKDILAERIIKTDQEYRLYKAPQKEFIRILKDHVSIQHITCGTIFNCIPHNFFSKNKKRCPRCTIKPKNLIGFKDSVGVKIIKGWLKKNRLYFKQEKTFDNLRSNITGRKLRFDFHIPDLNLMIEFDGKQHFDTRITNIFNEEKYERIHLYDNIKTQFCIDNNINLIRLNQSHIQNKNIYQTLDQFLNKGIYVIFLQY